MEVYFSHYQKFLIIGGTTKLLGKILLWQSGGYGVAIRAKLSPQPNTF